MITVGTEAGLIDEMHLAITPILLGSGGVLLRFYELTIGKIACRPKFTTVESSGWCSRADCEANIGIRAHPRAILRE